MNLKSTLEHIADEIKLVALVMLLEPADLKELRKQSARLNKLAIKLENISPTIHTSIQCSPRAHSTSHSQAPQ